MKYVHRKLMLMAAIGTFLMVAPLVVLYSMGYRMSLNGGAPQAVGVLLVETIPRRVNLDVNNKFIGRTPRAVANLPPGQIRVKLSLEGYSDWIKNLTISPTMATDLTGVRLFPSSPASQTLSDNVQSFSLSPNRRLIAVLKDHRFIHLLDAQGDQVFLPVALQEPPVSMLWSPDNSMIALEYEDGSFAILDISRPESVLQPVSSIKNIKDMSWDTRVPGRLLILTSDSRLLSYTAATSESELLVSNVATFATGARHIYLVDIYGKLKVFSLQGAFVEELPMELIDEVRSLLVTPAEQVVVHFENGRLAYLTKSSQLEDVSGDVMAAGWSPDGRMLYVQPAHNELYIYNVNNERLLYIPQKRMRLVTRLSRSIEHPQWFAGGHHLIYQVDDEIYVTEIDTRDHAISHLLAATNTDDIQVAVGEEGETIYHLKKTADGLTSLAVTSLTVDGK